VIRVVIGVVIRVVIGVVIRVVIGVVIRVVIGVVTGVREAAAGAGVMAGVPGTADMRVPPGRRCRSSIRGSPGARGWPRATWA
jgi:hypothetical protein